MIDFFMNHILIFFNIGLLVFTLLTFRTLYTNYRYLDSMTKYVILTSLITINIVFNGLFLIASEEKSLFAIIFSIILIGTPILVLIFMFGFSLFEDFYDTYKNNKLREKLKPITDEYQLSLRMVMKNELHLTLNMEGNFINMQSNQIQTELREKFESVGYKVSSFNTSVIILEKKGSR